MQSRDHKQEQQYLLAVLELAKGQLENAVAGSIKRQDALMAARQEMREDSARGLNDLYSMDGFHELVGLNQYAMPIAIQQKTQEMDEARIQALRRMLITPYFARIDIRFDDETEAEAIYIGRASLKDEQTRKGYVYDWRTPIASVFYRFGPGRVSYEAPAGLITGEMRLKRQFEIKEGELKYFFDADVVVEDEFLRNMLAQNASARMKAIVETIQKDQDVAIRDVEHELLMIDGAAGSGKTSIALHRVAYLMYQGHSSPLSAGNILVISPNTLFQRYISNILPELGEHSVETATFEQLFAEILEGAPLMKNSLRLEAIFTAPAGQETLLRSCTAFKVSDAFVRILDRFAEALPRNFIPFSDVYYGGQSLASGQRLKNRILADSTDMPLGARLARMERSLWNGVHERRSARMKQLRKLAQACTGHMLEKEELARAYSIHECAALKRHIHAFTRLNCRALYAALFTDEKAFYRLAKGIDLPDGIADILRHTRETLKQPVLSYEDAAAVAYLHLRTHGCTLFKDIRQVVVDEAQDYGLIHYALLKLLFPRARFTILGDIHQTLCGRVDPRHYERIADTLLLKNSAMIRLNKSFRCTKEILDFSRRFLEGEVNIQGFNRHGEPIGIHTARHTSECVEQIIRNIGNYEAQGFQSIALIVKTERDAAAWYRRLKDRRALSLICSDGAEEPRGVFLTPLALSKGLEFDVVLVLDCDTEHYHTSEDRNLLYVACTRALHRLNMFCVGELSPLIET